MRHWGTCPLDFQQFNKFNNFSRHFRTEQTLTFNFMWLPAWIYSFVTVYCRNYKIYSCVSPLTYFSSFFFTFVPPSQATDSSRNNLMFSEKNLNSRRCLTVKSCLYFRRRLQLRCIIFYTSGNTTAVHYDLSFNLNMFSVG